MGERARSHWAPKWRRLLTAKGAAPKDFTEFDRTVRGMLNRISTENACRLLPLDPCLRGAEMAAGDSPPWWAARFAALMLSSYLQVIHTNRCARGLAFRSADNVLPEYLDAVAPLLVQSPRLVTAVMAWFARLLSWHDLCWPTTRLLLLAAREDRNREALPSHSLGRLPSELITGRVLSFLRPPPSPAVEGFLESWLPTFNWSGDESDERDTVSVLVHLIMFAPSALWPRVSAFSFSLAEAALSYPVCEEGQIYIAASILTTISMRIQATGGSVKPNKADVQRHLTEDLGPLNRLIQVLAKKRQLKISAFVECRIQAAMEHARRVQECVVRLNESGVAQRVPLHMQCPDGA